MAVPEVYAGGIASSAIAKKRGLSWTQGFAVYLTDRRVVIAPVKTSHSPSWHLSAGSLFGSFGVKVTPFIDDAPPPLESVGGEKGLIQVPIDTISSIELKKPGSWYGQGSLRIGLTNGKEVKFGLLGGSGEYYGEPGDQVCDKLAALFRTRLPDRVSTK